MDKLEPNFVDDEREVEPYLGCLLIFNIGNDNCDKIGMTKDFERLLVDTVADAHASGWLVYFIFDNKRGASRTPDFLDYAPGQDIVGLSLKLMGTDEIDLPLLPGERVLQLKRLVESISSEPGMPIVGSSIVAAGLCKIAGDEVFIPPTKIQ